MKTRYVGAVWTIAAALGLAACGGVIEANDAEPRLIVGGGIGDGDILGRVNVYVIDEDTNAPIEGAAVSIGEAGSVMLQGTTDAGGLLTVDDDSLEGPTTVTVVSNGYPAVTWFGANGANMTIPLNPPGDRAVESATLRGTIEGWEELPDLGENHFHIGLVGYSQTDALGDPANEIRQPSAGMGLPPNACIKARFLTECNWQILSRTGKVAVFATIIDIDTKGTEDDSDDTSVVVGLAYKSGITVAQGVTQSGLSLTQVEVSAMNQVGFDTKSTPIGLSERAGLIGVNLGDSGIMMLGFSADPDNDKVFVPALTGEFSDASYRAFAMATTGEQSEEENDTEAASFILRYELDDVGTSVDFGDWMELPTALQASGGEYSFSPVEGAALHVGGIFDDEGEELWNLVSLDGREVFGLPAVSPDPLGSGARQFVVSAFEGDLDVQNLELENVLTKMTRFSRDRVLFDL